MTIARITDWTTEDYHAASTRVSASMLREYRSSPHRYHATHVARTIAPREPTPAMVLGAVVDDLLYPTRATPRYVAAPRVDRRTKDGKAAWADAEQAATAGGQTIVTADIMDTALAMVAAVRSSDLASSILALPDAQIQRAIIWDHALGVPCRALPDAVYHGAGMIVDLKTTSSADPHSWSKKIADYEYHCQAAWYRGAVRMLTGSTYSFAHLVVSSTPPHEVAVYALADDAIALGDAIQEHTLADLATVLASAGEYRAPWEREMTIIDLPRWVYAKEGSA